MNSVAARTAPWESVRLRYRVHASGKTIRTPTKIIAGAAKSHLRCRLAQAEKFLPAPAGPPGRRVRALRGGFNTDMVHLRKLGGDRGRAGAGLGSVPAGWCGA